jgi:alpha-glucuronidase
VRVAYRRAITALVIPGSSPTARVTREELRRGFKGLLGVDVPVVNAPQADGAIVVGTAESIPAIAGLP